MPHSRRPANEDPSFPEAGVYRGVEAVGAYTEQFLAEFADIRYLVNPDGSGFRLLVEDASLTDW